MEQIFCRIDDTAYLKSNLYEQDNALVAMVSYKGMIYGIVRPGEIPKYEFVTIHMAGDKIQTRPLMLIDGERPWEVPQPVLSWIRTNQDYLIESPCGNELLLVTKMAFNLFTRIHFRIFRIDVGEMECEELDNLDGRTIFISFYGNGFCRSSESFGAAVKPNSIYYTNESGMVIYVFDLEDRSITTLLPYPDADIDPYSSINYWVDLPYIPMKNSFYI